MYKLRCDLHSTEYKACELGFRLGSYMSLHWKLNSPDRLHHAQDSYFHHKSSGWLSAFSRFPAAHSHPGSYRTWHSLPQKVSKASAQLLQFPPTALCWHIPVIFPQYVALTLKCCTMQHCFQHFGKSPPALAQNTTILPTRLVLLHTNWQFYPIQVVMIL